MGKRRLGHGTRGTLAAGLVAAIVVIFAAVAGAGTSQLTSAASQYQYQYGQPPTVVTGAASVVTKTSATLDATVDPNGEAVSDCHFELGTSPSYTASVPCSSLPGSGSGAVTVTASLRGLVKGTSYHFRIVATNPAGTSYGSDRTFMTLTNPPIVKNLSPEVGPPKGGTPVTITGRNLAGAAAVYFGTAPASEVLVRSGSSITAVSPKGRAGTVKVSVTTPSGLSPVTSSDHFTYKKLKA